MGKCLKPTCFRMQISHLPDIRFGSFLVRSCLELPQLYSLLIHFFTYGSRKNTPDPQKNLSVNWHIFFSTGVKPRINDWGGVYPTKKVTPVIILLTKMGVFCVSKRPLRPHRYLIRCALLTLSSKTINLIFILLRSTFIYFYPRCIFDMHFSLISSLGWNFCMCCPFFHGSLSKLRQYAV